ncbi:hypothetical protein IMZ48_16500, partial [Candidatus Bathyarchaeota archaeon]|nr:hypothetical protein [Candidatus Bathyarchaeota archaeon]
MVAGILLEGRATARIPHILRRCFGSPYAGRAAIDTSSPTSSRAITPSTRRNASDNTYAARTRDHDRIRTEFLASLQAKPSPATEEATSDDGPSEMVRQAERRRSRKRSPDNQRPPPFTDAAVPPVMAGGPRDATSTPRTVHILGNDSKAGFLACELRHVYDSVHVLKTVGDKLVDYKFEPSRPPGDPTTAGAEDKQQDQVLFPTTSETPITKLITTARAVDAVSGIEQLKSRINDQTTLCLMNDGLGVAEELNETIFNEDASAKPEYILGRWSGNYLAREGLTAKGSQTLEDLDQAMDRPSSGNTRGFIHGHPDAAAEFSSYDPDQQMAIAVESALASDLIEELRESPNLNINFIAYHNWLHRKLKEMIFYSVVEPVVAIVDCKYDEVTTN